MTYLFAAFFILWLIVFLYLVRLFKRQQELMNEIQRRKNILDESVKSSNPEHPQPPQSP